MRDQKMSDIINLVGFEADKAKEDLQKEYADNDGVLHGIAKAIMNKNDINNPEVVCSL